MTKYIKKSKRQYTKEFIDNAISLAMTSPSVSGVAKNLGIPEATLHTWLKSSGKNKNTNKIDINKVLEENKKLNKELARIKQEQEILKKAAAYFAREMK